MMVLYRVAAAMLWFGVAFAIATVIIAVTLVLVVGAVLMGALMPGRTIKGQLRSLDFNTRVVIAQVKALNPR
jgi:hypothetical protein